MPADDVPYGIIASCFREKTVVPFLGAAASSVGATVGTALPCGGELAAFLAGKARYPGPVTDPLTKIAQFLEEVPADRDFLLKEIVGMFRERLPADYRTSLTDFMNGLGHASVPRLIITTNYDVLIEKTLEAMKVPYLAVSHIVKSRFAGRLLCYDSLEGLIPESSVLTIAGVEERLQALYGSDKDGVIIYKMHGSSHAMMAKGLLDSVVLTENDYIDFLANDLLKKIPPTILGAMRKARLLFLGYSLQDWNFRVLLRRLNAIHGVEREPNKRHWAILREADRVESRFWDRRGVNFYQISLDLFLRQLGDELQGTNV